VFVRVTRADKIAGGRLRMQLAFDTCLPEQWEPNGLPPAAPVDELGTVCVGANLCRGDHDFYELPASAGANVVGARIDGEVADWMIRSSSTLAAVAIGIPYEIDVMMFQPNTTTTNTEALATTTALLGNVTTAPAMNTTNARADDSQTRH
jgi:hypothetical protein